MADELSSARDHPVMACAIAVTAGFILMRGTVKVPDDILP